MVNISSYSHFTHLFVCDVSIFLPFPHDLVATVDITGLLCLPGMYCHCFMSSTCCSHQSGVNTLFIKVCLLS